MTCCRENFTLTSLFLFQTHHSAHVSWTTLPFTPGCHGGIPLFSIARAERDCTSAETRFRLSPKRTSPSKSVGASVQSTADNRNVRISLSNAGYTTFGGGVRVLATHSIRQFPFHFSSRASPCATRFRTSSNYIYYLHIVHFIQLHIFHFVFFSRHVTKVFFCVA